MNKAGLLVLGGTAEAVELAVVLSQISRLEVIYSLAGKTTKPNLPNCRVRVGGFGGIKGLEEYLLRANIAAVVDATHPFAAQMASNVAAASASLKIPRLKLVRQEWMPATGDNWICVPNVQEAAHYVEGSYWRVFLATGISDIETFTSAQYSKFFVRVIEPLQHALPLSDYELIFQRGPFVIADEQALFERLCIELVICKNSGGRGAEAKLTAARNCGIPVLMIARPEMPLGQIVPTIEEATRWVETVI